MSYTSEVLNQIATSDGATLHENVGKLHKESRISFRCKCGTDSDKSFVRIKISGLLCKTCTNISKNEKRAKTNLEKYGNTCSLQAESIKKKAENTCIERYGTTNCLKSDIIKDRIKKTNLEKYGSENPFASDIIKTKLKETCKEKYGTEFPMQNKEVALKTKTTNLEKYGVPVSSQADCVKEKAKQTNMKLYGSEHHIIPEIIEKIKKTNMEKYGVEYSFQAESVKDKIKESMLEKYGVDHNMKVNDIKNKAKNTNIEKYGVSHPMQLESFKEGVKTTNLQKYGVEHAIQSSEIQEKSQKNAIRFKEYKMPSGEIRKVQGYEPYALDMLINDYLEDDIITSRKNIPRIEYKMEDNKSHYYFPDIWIKSINKLIEVKSSWTYKLHQSLNECKWNAAKEKGYLMECWIFDNCKKRTDCLII